MEQHRYRHFKAKDFVLDADFRSWLSGTLPEMNPLWDAWLNENPEMSAEVEKARDMVSALRFKNYELDDSYVNLEWGKLKDVIECSESQSPEIETVSFKISWLWRTAAACVLFFSVFAIKQIWFSKSEINKSEFVTRTATKGERLTIKLIDGTTVRLNSGSTLSFPKVFPAGKRELKLIGEAFFEVAPDKNAPFIIHTGDVTTQVLGTTFGIEAYPESGEVRVAVVEGKVKVNSKPKATKASNEVFLVKDEMATFDKSAQKINVSEFDSKRQLAWKDGVLYFEKSDFEHVIKKLENWYGVKIQISGSVKLDSEWRFSGKFNHQSLDYILNVVRYPNQFSFEINNGIVNIK